MWPYWMMYLVLALPAMAAQRPVRDHSLLKWLVVGLLLTIFIGFRHEVGGDWGGYLRLFLYIDYFSFNQVILESDPRL